MVKFFLSLVASLGKYAFRIQNTYQFIDCSKENGVAVRSGCGGILKKWTWWRIKTSAFTLAHRISVNRLAIQLVGLEGVHMVWKVFIA